MKTNLFILACASSLAIIASCSKDAVPYEASVSNEPEWVNDETKCVPITFGNNLAQLKTRAAITDIEGVHFGISGVNKDATQPWTVGDTSSVLLCNVLGKSISNMVQFENLAGTELTYYYPIITKSNYTFYGYHTSSETIPAAVNPFEAEFTDSTICQTVQLDTTDILWAKAEATDLTDPSDPSHVVSGYNSEYCRSLRKWSATYVWDDYAPKFQFKHVTAALRFVVKAKDQEAFESFDGDVYISSFTLRGVTTKASLRIADRKDATREALLTPAEGFEDQTITLNDIEVHPTIAGEEVGSGLFIRPEDHRAGHLLSISFKLNQPYAKGEDVNERYVETVDVTIPLKTFEAGKRYTYNIIVNSLEDIQIIADVDQWIDDSDEDLYLAE